MDENQVKGAARELGGRIQRAAGEAAGSESLQAQGAANEALGNLQQRYGEALDTARGYAEEADRFVKAQPWMAVLIAGLIGLVIGHANGRAERRPVYLRKP